MHYTWAMATQPLVRRPELAWEAGESWAWLVGRPDAAKQRVGGVWCQGPVCRAGRVFPFHHCLPSWPTHPFCIPCRRKGQRTCRAPACVVVGWVDDDARTNKVDEVRKGRPAKQKKRHLDNTNACTHERGTIKVPFEETRCFMPRPLFQPIEWLARSRCSSTSVLSAAG